MLHHHLIYLLLPPYPLESRNLPENFPPPVINSNKEVVTLAESTWTALPNGGLEVRSCWANVVICEERCIGSGISKGMSFFDDENMTRSQQKQNKRITQGGVNTPQPHQTKVNRYHPADTVPREKLT